MNKKILGRLGVPMALVASAALVLTGCSGGGGDQTIADKAPTELKGTVSFWHFFSDREGEVIQSVVDDFEDANPGVTVEVHAGQDDEKMRKAISAGNKIDVGLSYSTDIVGNFCSSGAFRDLGPYIERDDVDLDQFSDVVRDYTQYDGTRCSLPVLTDVYGLYYNKDLLSDAGYDAPPKTLSELREMAEDLTELNADGSIKTLGFNPMMGFYENTAAHMSTAGGATWLNDDGTSAIGSDDAWQQLIEWQKDFIDELGYDKVNAFTSGLGQEFSADNAFQTGQVAMNLDGEYRTAFIDDQAPDLNYGTAPFPTADDHTDLYGGGFIQGNIAGIAKGSEQPELAWALLQYLTTDTDAVVKLSNGLKNVPTTQSALDSPDLEVTDQFQTFIDIAQNEHSGTTPATPSGSVLNAIQDYWAKYQAGDGGTLADGLKGVDKEIDDALELLSGP